MKDVKVALDKRGYSILIEPDILKKSGEIISKLGLGKKIAVITNPLVGGYYSSCLKKSLKQAGFNPKFIEVPDGEEYKSLEWAENLYNQLLDFKMDRQCAVISLGGGVIGDLAGFVAATFMRGISFIQIPTTLLAQVDSSIGGKVGVNLKRGKNLVGAFYQPKVIIIDPLVLKTLNKRELKCGMAEVIKYGVIKDKNLFAYLEANVNQIMNLELQALIHIIAVSCQIKANVVKIDEKEAGLRAILNFGHTIGHAIESLTGYQRYHHGEAVSIGMLAAARIAYVKGMISLKSVSCLERLIQCIGLPTTCPDLSSTEIWDAIRLDKKTIADKIRFILPKAIGRVIIDDSITEDLVAQVLGG